MKDNDISPRQTSFGLSGPRGKKGRGHLNELQRQQLADIVAHQAVTVGTVPKSQRKGYSDTPLFRTESQGTLF